MSVFNDDIIEIHKPITLGANDGVSAYNADEIEADYYSEENERKDTIVSNTDSNRKIIKEQGKDNSNGLAILALILSILGLLTSCFFIGTLLGGVALILAIRAYKRGQNKKTCIASFVCSGFAILFGIIVLVAVLLSPVQSTEIDNNSFITVEKMEE